MIKRDYHGLKHGEYLGYNEERKEKYFYCIFADGSETVQIETETGRRYHFGNIEYCSRILCADSLPFCQRGKIGYIASSARLRKVI